MFRYKDVITHKTSLPMQKSFTPVKNQVKSQPTPVQVSPKAKTVEFIKQFARVYSFQQSLQPGLRDYVVN